MSMSYRFQTWIHSGLNESAEMKISPELWENKFCSSAQVLNLGYLAKLNLKRDLKTCYFLIQILEMVWREITLITYSFRL